MPYLRYVFLVVGKFYAAAGRVWFKTSWRRKKAKNNYLYKYPVTRELWTCAVSSQLQAPGARDLITSKAHIKIGIRGKVRLWGGTIETISSGTSR